MYLPYIKNLSQEYLRDKRVLLRVDFNVPIEDDEVANDFRIRKTLPTIKFLYERCARIIILSHHSNTKQTLHPAARALNKHFNAYFVEDIFDSSSFEKMRDIEERGKQNIIFFENLRMWPGEKENDGVFAQHLASFGDIYVNDAFSASHRKHASITALPSMLPSYAGLLFAEELSALSRAFTPARPFLLILGGAKAGTKLPLAEQYLPHADAIFIGGAPANNIFKATGLEVGKSAVEEAEADIAALSRSEKVRVPVDVVVKNEEGAFVKKPNEVSACDVILDAGPETAEELARMVERAACIVWNGPLGEYEEAGFEHGTERLIRVLKESDADKIIGGGNTVAMISKMGLEDSFPFLSTAGGAMLQFLSDETLPGITALQKT